MRTKCKKFVSIHKAWEDLQEAYEFNKGEMSGRRFTVSLQDWNMIRELHTKRIDLIGRSFSLYLGSSFSDRIKKMIGFGDVRFILLDVGLKRVAEERNLKLFFKVLIHGRHYEVGVEEKMFSVPLMSYMRGN